MTDTGCGERGAASVTVEGAAWVLVGVLAAALRLFQLGWRPLSESEAVQALAAYGLTRGGLSTAPAGMVPALFTGNVVGFTLFGASDAAARLLPAVAGIVLVLLPYGLRHRLGRGGALAASLLLALSPSAVYFSRSLDSAIVVAACGLALVVGLMRYLDSRRPAGLYVAAAALGLGLCSGPAFFSLLVVLGSFALLLFLAARLRGWSTGWSSVAGAWSDLRTQRALTVRAGIVLAASFGLTATTLVLHLAGLGDAADLVGTWAQGFLPETGGQPLVYPLLLLLRYEPLIFLLGLVAWIWVIYAYWNCRGSPDAKTGRTDWEGKSVPRSAFPFALLLAYWAIAATVLVLVAGQRPAGNILLVVVPLALLGGQGAERAWRWIGRRGLWVEAGAIAAVALVLLAFLYLQLASYSLVDGASSVSVGGLTLPASSSYLVLAGVAVVLLVGLAAAAWVWRGTGALVSGSWLAVVLFLGLVGVKMMWTLNFSHAADPRELMVGQAIGPEVRAFVEELEALSLAESGDAHTLRIAVDQSTGPVVAWYLREFDDLVLMPTLWAPPGTVAAVTLALDEPAIGETYRGQGFALRSSWRPWGLRGRDLVRWLFFTGGSPPTVDQEVVVWVTDAP